MKDDLFGDGTIYSPPKSKEITYSWNVTETEPRPEKPSIIGAPRNSGFQTEYGCYGNTQADFKIDMKGAYLVLGELKELKTGEITSNYLIPNGNSVSLRLKDCGVGYPFKPRTYYQVRFKVISIDGSESPFSGYVTFRAGDWKLDRR